MASVTWRWRSVFFIQSLVGGQNIRRQSVVGVGNPIVAEEMECDLPGRFQVGWFLAACCRLRAESYLYNPILLLYSFTGGPTNFVSRVLAAAARRVAVAEIG